MHLFGTECAQGAPPDRKLQRHVRAEQGDGFGGYSDDPTAERNGGDDSIHPPEQNEEDNLVAYVNQQFEEMGRETQTEQGLVRQDIVECRRGIARYDQSILDIANIERTGYDPGQAQDAENPRQTTGGQPFRIRI